MRRNAATLLRALDGSELWAVVKADGYGHGARDVAGAALGAARPVLCVATVAGGARAARRVPDRAHPRHGPVAEPRHRRTPATQRLELVSRRRRGADGRPVAPEARHRHGPLGLVGAPRRPGSGVVGLMTPPRDRRLRRGVRQPQIERFRAATERTRTSRATSRTAPPRSRYPRPLRRRALRHRALRPVAVRHRPGGGRARAGAALGELPRAGQAARGRARAPATAARFVAERDTWIGIVPVGYADGFRRDLTGTEVRVAGERRRVVGTISMDAFAVELDRELPVGTPVDDHRPRHARRGARARCRHDHVRARLRASRAGPHEGPAYRDVRHSRWAVSAT